MPLKENKAAVIGGSSGRGQQRLPTRLKPCFRKHCWPEQSLDIRRRTTGAFFESQIQRYSIDNVTDQR